MNADFQSSIQALLPDQPVHAIKKLFGEASYREYFRVQTQTNQSYIVMKIPPGKQSVSEEITNYQGPKDELPFLNMARYLESCDLPAPRVLATDLTQGLILLQDLGDQTLEKVLENCNEAMQLFFYRQAIELLLKFQQAGANQPSEDCMAFQRSFDAHLLEWEFEHFLAYGIEDRLQVKIPQAKRDHLQSLAKNLVQEITEIPYGLTHRDFQSRNLILYGYEFYLIDFQDALLGPPQYDLVALLRDSYVELPFATVERLIDDYLEGRQKIGLEALADFRKGFHLITVQRKLKDAGRFQFIKTEKGNPNFMTHLPTSLAYAKKAFEFLPEHQELYQGIVEYLPEWQSV